jgi:sulfur carrier protein ThiS
MPIGKRVTINFGLSNTIEKQVPEGTTVGDILSDPNYKAILGFPDSVVAKIDGVTQDRSTEVEDGDVVDIEVQANTKA